VSSGADWLLGDVGKPKKGKKPGTLYPKEGVALLDDVEEYLESEASAKLLAPPAAAKALNAAIGTAYDKAMELMRSGLTGEALCLLIAEKSPRSRTGTRISTETVKAVLQGMQKLGEWVKP
jgi:hypothetical protein